MQHLGKILPIDGYKVQIQGSLPKDYLASLTHLYQPLIGIEAISLYHLLMQEEVMLDNDQVQTHHTLMNYLNIPLDRIYEARLKLEGIGLLQTYQREDENKVYYLYNLLAPFRPAAFFDDLMLAELLYRQIGRVKYTELQQFYAKKPTDFVGEDITTSFNDVFQAFQLHGVQPSKSTEKKNDVGVGVPLEKLDFALLSQTVKRKMIPVEKVLTEKNKRIITQLQQLYDLAMYELEQAINWALTDENDIDVEQLQAACEDLFREKVGTVDMKLAMKQLDKSPEPQEPQTAMTKSLHRLETISTKELLDDLSVGDHAGEQDLKMVSDIMIKQGIPTQVMNVLVTYVMHQTNNQLSRPYLEKIASHWSRLQFKTAKEAMNYILHPPEKKQKQWNNKGSRKSTEVIPEWFKERKQQAKQQEKNEEQPMTAEDKRAQEEMIALLEKYNIKNN